MDKQYRKCHNVTKIYCIDLKIMMRELHSNTSPVEEGSSSFSKYVYKKKGLEDFDCSPTTGACNVSQNA